MTDLPPENFEYVAGSWAAESSIRGDLSAIPGLGLTKIYASPGEWSLGEMQKDEVVILTYKAKVGSGAATGVYPDLAWAQGKNPIGEELIALSAASDFVDNQGVVDDNFVGTKIAVDNPVAPPTVKVRADKDEIIEEVEVKVKGATLPATGADGIWIWIALLGTVLGAAMLWTGRRLKTKKAFKMNKAIGFFLGVVILGTLSSSVQAAGISARLAEPAATVNSNFNLDFVAMDIQNQIGRASCRERV